MYDVYYTTAGGPWFNSGADMWVTNWIKEVAPDLKVKPLLIFHRHKPVNYEEYPIDIDHIWTINEDEIIEKFNGARKIHILHGYYTPTKSIHQNLEKIDSIVFHNLTKISLVAQLQKEKYLHWYGNWQYESEMIDKIKNKIWVGLYHFPYKTENLYNITNVYNFKENKELSESTKIAFAARVEGRKNLEYLDNLESLIFTNSETFEKYYRKKFGYTFLKSKIYTFNYKNKNKFYDLNWGISHSCFENEPFGYGIFEAIDWGKLPIIHKDWCGGLDYKYKANNEETFKETYETICQDDYQTRKTEFEKLKNWMIKNFSNKDEWKEKLLDIYNGE
jgi:hypothetical protein